MRDIKSVASLGEAAEESAASHGMKFMQGATTERVAGVVSAMSYNPRIDQETAMSKRTTLIASTLVGVLALPAGFALAADQQSAQQQAQAQVQDQQQELVYGSQMMTPEERAAYRAKMRAATTVEEREKIRKEHHEAMKLRAKERGVTIPDEPPVPGGGMGPGGGGMDPGGGRGRGYGY
jgi:uncharacterized protein HemX